MEIINVSEHDGLSIVGTHEAIKNDGLKDFVNLIGNCTFSKETQIMKETVISFLEILEETTIEGQDNDLSDDFINGVKETIEYARIWFESNGIDEFEINKIE